MPAPVYKRRQAAQAIHEVAERYNDLAEAVRDPELRVPASPDWTVVEAFAHVASVVPRYIKGAQQQGEWTETAGDLPELNAREVDALASSDASRLATNINESAVDVIDLIDSLGDEQPVFTFHGGARISADVSLGILLGELVVHGHDIAETVHQPWPIDPHHVELIQAGLDPILPGWLAPDKGKGHTANYELRLRHQGVHRFAFDDGRLVMNPPGDFRPDVVISADPVAYLLVVYKRRGQWPAIFTGKLVAWGRKPWLAFRFASLFHQP